METKGGVKLTNILKIDFFLYFVVKVYHQKMSSKYPVKIEILIFKKKLIFKNNNFSFYFHVR